MEIHSLEKEKEKFPLFKKSDFAIFCIFPLRKKQIEKKHTLRKRKHQRKIVFKEANAKRWIMKTFFFFLENPYMQLCIAYGFYLCKFEFMIFQDHWLYYALFFYIHSRCEAAEKKICCASRTHCLKKERKERIIIETENFSIYKLYLCLFLGYLGLEPRTYRLKAEYSTIELVTQFFFLWKFIFQRKKNFKNIKDFHHEQIIKQLLKDLLQEWKLN